ncbi:MAG TPA: neutral/alkaline non-lysosomal ceramidase N-terminal domain-containing protein [Sediminibacterium sp.]|nr:neutral/alkaline non-lysosomal ceramidase N-terminal domain-containing protein [Sediminibacterium sp.]HQS56219.1 neutral/alkaline non-lysosomal ceramidase N-terminal domain-containing protein [Sediminibacterium sp.]
MKFLKILLKSIMIIIALVMIAIPFFIRRADRTPIEQTDFHQQMLSIFDSLKQGPTTIDTNTQLLAGWSKANLTPAKPMPTAGYGKREGKPYQTIHDSIYARAIYLQQGQNQAAIVSCDLLIIPPELTLLLKQKIPAIGMNFSEVYIGATHSHNSIGGWGKRYIGELFAGKYDAAMVEKLAEKIVQAISIAKGKAKPVQLSYASIAQPDLVKNRTVGEKGTEDPFLRMIYLQGLEPLAPKAILTSFAAHATTLSDSVMRLSRDYPGQLVDGLEKDLGFDQALHLAGAVGSMGPEEETGTTDWEQLSHVANGLKNAIQQNAISLPLKPNLKVLTLKLPMREPQWRFAKDWCFRHWLWTKLYGDYDNEVKMLRIGSLVMVGLPCDFSGELMKDLTDYAATKGKQLMVTSFNGGYVGYITKDSYYDHPGYETRIMNWFGPGNAAYFSEVVRKLVDLP